MQKQLVALSDWSDADTCRRRSFPRPRQVPKLELSETFSLPTGNSGNGLKGVSRPDKTCIIMNSKLSHYLLSSLVASTLALAQTALAAEANLSKTYTVKPGGQLVLEAERGAVDVITDATGEAR